MSYLDRLSVWKLVAVLTLTGFGATALEAKENAAEQARAALREHCYQCHSGPGSSGGDVDFLDREALVESGFVEPGDADASYLLERILDKSMPPLTYRERNPVTKSQQWAIQEWIASGAPSLADNETSKQFLPLPRVLAGVRDFLRDRDAKERRFFRFFTLHQVYNSPSVSPADLPLYRAALSKALNSLSWNPEIVLPLEVISEGSELDGVVYAIDLRTLVDSEGVTWADRGFWGKITERYPYGLSYPDVTSDNRHALLEEIIGLIDPRASSVRLPILRADWFIATATRPPLYHTLLDLPDDAKVLEKSLGVNIPAALLQPTTPRIARAGFAKSGVSGQNRLLERSRGRFGAYWKSYDFKPSATTASLIRFPLGPLNLFPTGEHPFTDQAFVHDGGEIIFHLPNGLQGYLLVDGEDKRIDAGPIDVVSDALKTSGTPEIVNGLSCMACHREGMINFTDEIATSSGVFGEAADQVRRLYPNKSDFDALVERDRKQFLEAIEEATGPFWRTSDGNQSKQIREFPEPIGEVARLYRFVYLDAGALAAELDLASADEVVNRAGKRTIKRLGLEFVTRGGALSRNVWEASDGLSLMQELAIEVGYTPVK